MDLDPLLLSRIQFAFVISFHILFPAFTIGLAAFIAMLELQWLATRRAVYATISRFWTTIFAISFGMGVVSGIVMSYQFGTNWSRFTDHTANVLGPLLSYEVLTAFFLEATFLGLLLFGRGRVPHWMITLSAFMVALGTLVSAFWILSANSWMHTPAGYILRDDGFHVTNWWEAIFNPSFLYRLAHMVTACFLTTGFVVIGVGAWYVLKGRSGKPERLMLSMTVWLVAALVPLQILLGDLHGLNTFKHQPAKVAAMEGHWESQRGAPLILFALPDQEAMANRWELSVPKLGSLILTHDWNGQVRGLEEWPRDERPYVPIVFWSFRIMVGAGLIMLGLAVWGLYLRLRGRLFQASLFHRLCVWTHPIGFLAVIAGWITTEVGRQPWIVYGLMRTADGLTPALDGATVLWSLISYALVYAIIFGAGVFFILRLIRRGLQDEERTPVPQAAGQSGAAAFHGGGDH